MFERLTADARATVIGAQQHARRLGHRPIGTEHVLRSVVDGSSRVAATLAAHGITADTVEADLARHMGAGRDADRRALASIGIDLDAVLATSGSDLREHAVPRPRRRRWWPRRRQRCNQTTPTRDRAHIPFSPRANAPYGVCRYSGSQRAQRVGLPSKSRSTKPLSTMCPMTRRKWSVAQTRSSWLATRLRKMVVS